MMTPEQKERIKARMKEYNQRPEVKARKKALARDYYQRPGVKEHIKALRKNPERIAVRKAYYEREDVKLKIKDYADNYRSKPDNKFRQAKNNWRIQGVKITEEEAKLWFERTKGTCDWCSRTALQEGTNKYLCLDHDHQTGLPRRVLCYACNLIEGYIKYMTKEQLQCMAMSLANYKAR